MTKEELKKAQEKSNKMDKVLATAHWIQVREAKRAYAHTSDSDLLDFFHALRNTKESFTYDECRLELLRRMHEGLQV